MDRLLNGYRGWWAALAVVLALALVRLPWTWAAALMGAALWLVAVAWEPLLGVGTALFVAPWRAYLAAYVPAIPSRTGDLLLGATLGLWLLGLLARRVRRLPLPPLLGPLLLFLGVGLLSLLRAADAMMGFLEWLKWAELTAVLLLVWERLHRRGRQGVAIVLAALAALLLFQAGMGLWQFALRGDGPPHFAIREGLYRAYGTFEQPNPFAGLMGMGAALFAGLSVGALGRGKRLRPAVLTATAGVALASLAALVASWSRGGWMGFAAAVAVMTAALFLPLRDLRRWLAAGGALLLAATGWPLLWTHLPAALRDRLIGFLAYTRFRDVRGAAVDATNYAVMERMAHWQAALGMWRDHLWLGVGLGCYEAAYVDYRLLPWPNALGHAHNVYLTLLAETGLLGLAAYLLLFAALFFRLLRALPRLGGWRRGLAVGLLGAWTHFLVHDLVDQLLVNGMQIVVGLLLALSAWVIVASDDKEGSNGLE